MQFFKRTALLGPPIRLPQVIFVMLTVCASLISILLPATAKTVEPPSLTVRKHFRLAPFYRQWVDVEGLPVVASEKVNPYALKEAAWLIRRMIGHRPEVLRAMVKNRVRVSVMAYNEMTTRIPEHSDLSPGFYWDRRARGLGATPVRPAVSCGEENLLNYSGDPYMTENILIHEFSHSLHEMGLNIVDPGFDNRLRATFEAAMKKGLWKGTYASTNKEEYWAEGAQSWFNTNGQNDAEHNHVDTRTKLKDYDPALAMLLAEVFGDTDWRYTPASTRTHLPHLRGFNPQDAPTFVWPPETAECSHKLREPEGSGKGCSEWVDLKRYESSLLSRLIRAIRNGPDTEIIFVNNSTAEITFFWIEPDGKERYYGRVPAGAFGIQTTRAGHIWLVKDQNGVNLAAFQAKQKTGRALIVRDLTGERSPGNGGDRWVKLKRYDPSQLSRLKSYNGRNTEVIFVNNGTTEITFYWMDPTGKERYYGRVPAGVSGMQPTYAGHIWLVKDQNGKDLAVFQAEKNRGRALIGTE